MSRLGAVLVTVACLLGLAPAAQAATVRLEGDALSIAARRG